MKRETSEGANSDVQARDDGGVDQVAAIKARRNGQIVDMF